MKPDLYTKSVLTVIALMLAVVACNQYVSPRATVEAQGTLAGVQIAGAQFGFWALDTRSGDLWYYSPTDGTDSGTLKVKPYGKFARLGGLPTR
jgi:hypothetical protein